MHAARCLAWLMLVAGLVSPAFAQDGSILKGPIARAAEREASRLVAAQATTAPGNVPLRKVLPTDWTRVVRLNPGTEIILTTDSGGGGYKYRFLYAEPDGVTILNVGDPAIPPKVRKALVSMGVEHPEYFVLARNGRSLPLTKDVRIGPDGVFDGERRLFELVHVAQPVSRPDVIEISAITKHVGQHAKRGLLAGAVVGAVLGAASAASYTGNEGYDNVPAMAFVGAIMGGGVGLEWGTIIGIVAPRSPMLIYHRP